MKKKERYKLLNYAKNQYSKAFDRDYQFKILPRKELHDLLKQYKHSMVCEWWYCCYGLYENCWQELFDEGIWGYTQKEVDDHISYIIDFYSRYCKKDSRILYHKSEDEGMVDVIFVMRDICKRDFLFTFTNEC